MNACFMKVLNISIMTGWLVLAVLLLRFALKKAPKWVRCLLWGLVALRLVLPINIQSKLSLLPSAETFRKEAVTVEAEEQDEPMRYERVVLRSGIAMVDDAVNPVMARTETAMTKRADSAAAWIWAVGVGAMLLYSAAAYIYMKIKVRASLETEPGVFVCDEVKDPFILGAIVPRIYLPSGLDERSRENILAHERAHIRRLDHIWKPLGFLLLSIHWFNPLIWLAFILLSRDIEFACDEKVISLLDAEGKASYSDTLLAFSRTRKALAVCPVAFGEVGVKQRVRSVLGYRKSALWVVFMALIASAVVAVCFLTSPIPAMAAEAGDAVMTIAPKKSLPGKLSAGGKEEPEEEEGMLVSFTDRMMCVKPNCETAE